MRIIMTADKRYLLGHENSIIPGLTLLEGDVTINGNEIKINDDVIAEFRNRDIHLNDKLISERFGNTKPLKSNLLYMYQQEDNSWNMQRRV